MRCLIGSLKEFLGFSEFFARNRENRVFGQLIKSILQSVYREEKLTNELRNLVKLYNGKVAKYDQ